MVSPVYDFVPIIESSKCITVMKAFFVIFIVDFILFISVFIADFFLFIALFDINFVIAIRQ